MRWINAHDEQVGVVTRVAHQRQHAAGAGVEGDHGATTAFQGRGGGALQRGIQVQGEVLAGHGRRGVHHPPHPAAGIHLDALPTDVAVQHVLVELLHAEAAHELDAAVALRVQPLGVFRGHPAHGAQGVCREFGERVVAQVFVRDPRTRPAMPIDAHTRHLRFGKVELQRDRLVGPPVPHPAVELRDVGIVQIDPFA